MSASAATLQQAISLPSQHPDEDRRFQRILAIVAGILLLLGVIIPYLPVFQEELPEEIEQRRVVTLIVEEPREEAMYEGEQPQPAPVPEQRQPEPEPQPTPAPQPEPQAQPQAAPEPTPPQPSAREQAEQSGLLAMRDSLSDLADDSAGTLAEGPLSTEGNEDAQVSRDLISSRAGQASGGIAFGQIGRVSGGGAEIAGRGAQQVESPVGALPPPGGEGGKGRVATRTNEEIQLVFDRNKHSVYGLYNHALRDNPELRGRIVLQLTIAPSGAVTDIDVISSELDAPSLERQIAARVEQFDFGAKDVPPVTITYPIEFFPAS